MTFIHAADIVTSDISHVTKLYIYFYIYLFVIHVICDKLFLYLHSVKRRMRYNPEKIVTHGYELHM